MSTSRVRAVKWIAFIMKMINWLFVCDRLTSSRTQSAPQLLCETFVAGLECARVHLSPECDANKNDYLHNKIRRLVWQCWLCSVLAVPLNAECKLHAIKEPAETCDWQHSESNFGHRWLSIAIANYNFTFCYVRLSCGNNNRKLPGHFHMIAHAIVACNNRNVHECTECQCKNRSVSGVSLDFAAAANVSTLDWIVLANTNELWHLSICFRFLHELHYRQASLPFAILFACIDRCEFVATMHVNSVPFLFLWCYRWLAS